MLNYTPSDLDHVEPAPPLNAWGKEAIIDVYDIEKEISPEYLKEWVSDLVKTIDMVAYGDPEILHFGHGDPKLAGWSIKQWIETSHIIAHFNDYDNSAAINVFSCKNFDTGVVYNHIMKWFDPTSVVINELERIKER